MSPVNLQMAQMVSTVKDAGAVSGGHVTGMDVTVDGTGRIPHRRK